MKNANENRLKIRGFGLSAAAVSYSILLFLAAQFAVVLVSVPLARFFPAMGNSTWLMMLPYGLILTLFVLYLLASFYTVILDPEQIILTWMGIPIRKIPASQLRLFCAIGDNREDVLCLTAHSVEELASRREAKLLRCYFTKYEVPLRKKSANWAENFAREYLNALRNHPFGIFQDPLTIMMPMQTSIQYLIDTMYPEIPYKNFTDMTACPPIKENVAPCFPLQLSDHRVDLREDGIYVSANKKKRFCIQAKDIKTVVRVDIFTSYAKYFPHRLPILFVTKMTEEELASNAPKNLRGIAPDLLPNRQALLAQACANVLSMRWTARKTDSCPLHLTETNANRIQALYPNAQWIDLSDSWAKNHGSRSRETGTDRAAP